ncbi:UNVERIFIED_CONTAM: hypothetical protein RKD50_004887 [Streptomyces canus]
MKDAGTGAVFVSGSKTGGGAVGVREGLRELVLGESGQLLEDALGGLDVHLRERTGAVQLVPPEYFEEVELDVAQIRLVVPHGDGSVKSSARHVVPRASSHTNK